MVDGLDVEKFHFCTPTEDEGWEPGADRGENKDERQ
jgi:hypothetical protein